MPAIRPIWKGQLRLSLVSIAVELYTATKTNAKVTFRQIHEPSGKPIKYEKVVPGVGPVDRDEIMKGFEVKTGDFVLLTDEEIDAVKLETRRTLDLTQFVGACEIDPIYFDKAYFVAPADELAEDAFRVIRDALRQTEKVGLGQLALRGKEYLVALKPTGTGMLLETLHYEDEIRKSDPFFASIPAKKADPELLEVAVALMNKKTAPFDSSAFKDHYQAALRTLVEEKIASKGGRVSVTKADEAARPEGDNVIDLMAALKRSLEVSSSKGRTGKGKSTKASAAAPRRKAVSTRVKAAPRRGASRSSRKRAG
ncbi:MAG: Ku protein [Gemmatimonadota bacterium]